MSRGKEDSGPGGSGVRRGLLRVRGGRRPTPLFGVSLGPRVFSCAGSGFPKCVELMLP